MSYFFTADEHYNHTNIIKYSNRPFSSIEEMAEELIRRHNEIVTKIDITVHAGDFCWLSKTGDVYKYYINRLNGNHIFVKGDHDRWVKGRAAGHLWQKRIDSIHVVVTHWSMRVWPRSHYNSWNLYGHSHGRLEGVGKAMDVGVDTHNYYPYSWDEIKAIMADKPDNFNLVRER